MMSLLLRTIKSYPKGKLAEELIYILDKDCETSIIPKKLTAEPAGMVVEEPNSILSIEI